MKADQLTPARLRELATKCDRAADSPVAQHVTDFTEMATGLRAYADALDVKVDVEDAGAPAAFPIASLVRHKKTEGTYIVLATPTEGAKVIGGSGAWVPGYIYFRTADHCIFGQPQYRFEDGRFEQLKSDLTLADRDSILRRLLGGQP